MGSLSAQKGASLLALEPLRVERKEHEQWRSGSVAKRWARQYPSVFDERDLELALKRCRSGRHYFEWAAARHLHSATGFDALVCKYEFGNHDRKKRLVEQLLDPAVLSVLRDRKGNGRAQAPDLLMYSPDLSSYFFCEVKGPTDKLRPSQLRRFAALARAARQPIHMLHVEWS